MKKVICAVCLFLILVLSGCTLNLPEVSVTAGYEYEYRTTVPSETEQTTEALLQEEETTAEAVTEESTVMPEITTVSAVEPGTTQVSSPPASGDAAETTEPVSVSPEMNLSISMPDKNGTMVTDKSADNKFIKLISEGRKIKSDMLVAVFAVPESGQNYVFEFTDSTKRTADTLRRVYLIDSSGKVTGVAAANGSEKENLSSAENWFCMNVLIKGVIFPAIADELK